MEFTGFFTSRADLPADALAISATTHLDAANALAEMIRNKEGLEHLFDTLIWYDSFDLGGLD